MVLVRILRRGVSLLEHQAKVLLHSHGICVQPFITLEDSSGNDTNTASFESNLYVVKAQIYAGGRGRGHFREDPSLRGVQLVRKSLQSALDMARRMLGKHLCTAQTSPSGELVRSVMVAKAMPRLLQEAYVALMLLPPHLQPIILASPQGGVDVESQSGNARQFSFTHDPMDIVEHVFPHLDLHTRMSASGQLEGLKRCFVQNDLTQLEVNPWSIVSHDGVVGTDEGVATKGGEPNEGRELQVMCIDAKVQVDDNALFRQPNIMRIASLGEEEGGGNYVPLNGGDGQIACVVNGAGLAMATADLLTALGGRPLNFLDLGGSADASSVRDCILRLYGLHGPQCQAILVNVFGGIVRCDDVVRGLLDSARCLSVPIVARLRGTNEREALQLLSASDISHVYLEGDLKKAAQLAITLAASQKDPANEQQPKAALLPS
jgi:succinyl-CoA synthetase beta subunit